MNSERIPYWFNNKSKDKLQTNMVYHHTNAVNY